VANILRQRKFDLAPLDQVGWLSEQPTEFKHWASMVGNWQDYVAGQTVYFAGDPSNGLYGLATGAVELTFPLIAEEPISIYRAEPGFWIGDSAELSDEPRVVTLSAASDCRLLYIPHAAIRADLERNPHHWQSYYRLSHSNVKTAVTLLAESLALSVRARVCRRLLKLTEFSAEVQLTHDQLAKFLGLARTTVSEELARLSAGGAVYTGYGRIEVLDRTYLMRYRDEQ
jgi:CRP/FNR family transcriptional regulator, cyclic AMP receptor protein